ncbi:MAG: DUF6448 family protein [Candidatus Binatia bacterium]
MKVSLVRTVALLTILACGPAPVFAHCDRLDGPVVTAARAALDSGNVNLVLIWVQKGDETDIKKAFEQTLAVRKLNPEAKELADRYFFETLVRVHRAGEGAPYTGLKPAGRDLGPAISAADTALKHATDERLVTLLTDAVQHGVRERFAAANAKKTFDKNDVEAGRTYVRAYVSYLHYVEHIYEATKAPAHGPSHQEQVSAAHTE